MDSLDTFLHHALVQSVMTAVDWMAWLWFALMVLAGLVLGFLVIIQTLGISITPLITALGIGGLAVSLAFQDTLGNLFAGLQLLVTRQIMPGDYVRLESGEEGYVVDITWRNTTIRHIHQYWFVIPNTKLSTVIVSNFHKPAQPIMVVFPVGVHYATDLKHVERIILEVMNRLREEREEILKVFDPFVRFHTFNDFNIDCNVHFKVKEYYDKLIVQHELVKLLHRRFNEEGIVIPFPIRTLEWMDPKAPLPLQNS